MLLVSFAAFHQNKVPYVPPKVRSLFYPELTVPHFTSITKKLLLATGIISGVNRRGQSGRWRGRFVLLPPSKRIYLAPVCFPVTHSTDRVLCSLWILRKPGHFVLEASVSERFLDRCWARVLMFYDVGKVLKIDVKEGSTFIIGGHCCQLLWLMFGDLYCW